MVLKLEDGSLLCSGDKDALLQSAGLKKGDSMKLEVSTAPDK